MNVKPKIDLVEVLNADPEKLYTDKNISAADLCKQLLSESQAQGCDLSTEAGRKSIASRAYAVSQLKTKLDEAGFARTEKHRKVVDGVNLLRKVLKSSLDEVRDKIRKPLDDWNIQEKARVDTHQQVLNQIDATLTILESDTGETIEKRIAWLDELDTSETALQEFSERVSAAVFLSLEQLRPALDRIRKSEADQKELDRLRQENQEREERARLTREHEEQAALVERQEQERTETARLQKLAQETAVKEAADKARKDALATAEQERLDQETETERLRLAEEARVADIEHRKKVEATVAFAIKGAGRITDKQTGHIVEALKNGIIPHVRIEY